ncbi:HAMP domain-containing sensor histidine kinase [Bacillus benzoevorans]|uniref:histidine kinase n=1 Tax=Bacillus benzoevorans TaxID=1456 RepID=A0A7X0LVC0_9BACI|nr:HAMP domain-containing sensor histidine kinase [Bacillus benzoevorans]MBB6445468.1 signal transduction histidine kinase [Bacillus benzoevorans]
MGTRSKSFSHSIWTKIIVFVVVILCFTGAVREFLNAAVLNEGDFAIVFEEDYFQSSSYIRKSEKIIGSLARLINEYKNEKHILNGGTISEDEIRAEEDHLYTEFQMNSRSFNPELSEAQNYEKFKEEYASKLSQAREQLIKHDLREYHSITQNLQRINQPLYYASDGVNVWSNTTKKEKSQFTSYPAYMIFENYKSEFYPKQLNDSEYMYWIKETTASLDVEKPVVYLAYTEDFLKQQMKEWQDDKTAITTSLYRLIGFLAGLVLSLLYLIIVIGRKSFHDEKVHLNAFDKLFNDVNFIGCIGLIALWLGSLSAFGSEYAEKILIPITIPIAAAGLILVLSLVRHIKNRTLLKHTLIYRMLHGFFSFFRDVYNNGSMAIKTVLIVVGYPVLIALTFFMFPVTIGFAAWFALKKIKAFKTIQEGVERIKGGDLQHSIEIEGKGEFSQLAANINSISDGLKNAVDNELKSERLKTELITNVSHDIRTPLTSIITYVDLLKREEDPVKVEEYVAVLEQKSQRLKVLTDDLFAAAKASSGNIPVSLERIDIASLINQGLGEVSEKIEAMELAFKFNHPEEKVYISADGRLMWRAIENLLSNIFKYALKGSRVYIDIEDTGNDVLLTFKNISAYELNISADELMERFKRGDESRTSQGSGLGLSIAKSLIELQKGKFQIQVDGDLFKAMIYMPKSHHNHK